MEKRGYIHPDWTPSGDKEQPKSASVKGKQITKLDNDVTKRASNKVKEKMMEEKSYDKEP